MQKLPNIFYCLKAISLLTLTLVTASQTFASEPRSGNAPTAINDNFTAQKNKELTVDASGVLANDTDDESDPLTAAIVSNPTSGTVTLNPDGSFTYSPDKNFEGFDSFTYTASDGTSDSNTATVSVAVTTGGKAPPVPVADFNASPSSGSAPLPVAFDAGNSSADTGATIASYAWDFGDGTTTTTTTPTANNTYATAGTFNASLVVTDSQGLVSTRAVQTILIGDGTTSDGGLYAKKFACTVNWAKHKAGETADLVQILGQMNPNGLTGSVAGATFAVSLNGIQVGSGTLTSNGTFSSPKGTTPSLKILLKGSNGQFKFIAKGLDLRNALGVVDASEEKALPVNVEIAITGSTMKFPTVSGVLEAAYKSVKGKNAKAKYSFTKNNSLTGIFMSLKTAAVGSDTGHKLKILGVIIGDLGVPIVPTGDITITIGGSGGSGGDVITVPVTTSGSGALSTITGSSVPEIKKFSISNAKKKLLLLTNELANTGIPTTTGTSTELLISMSVPTADGTLTFQTTVELQRKSTTSKSWKR